MVFTYEMLSQEYYDNIVQGFSQCIVVWRLVVSIKLGQYCIGNCHGIRISENTSEKT